MSGALRSPGQRLGTDRILGNHEARILALERSPSGDSCVVLIEEIVVAVDGDPVVFNDIPQTYRHLGIEGVFGVNNSGGPWSIAFEALDTDQHWGWSSVQFDTSALTTEYQVDDLTPEASDMVPNVNVISAAEDVLSFCYYTAKFPYYYTDDRAKGVLWQAVAMIEDSFVKHQTGGAISAYHGEQAAEKNPITDLTFTAAVGQDWAAGTMVSLYGIC